MANQYTDNLARDTAMKTEYVTTKISMRKLAEKYGMTENGVRPISRRDGWTKARKKYREKLQEETVSEVAKGISKRVTTINKAHFSTWEKMLVLINKALDEYEVQLIHTSGPYKGDIKIGKLESIAKVMLMIQQGQREAKGIGNPVELKKLEIAFKRLELDAKKLAGEPDEIEDDGFMDALKAEVDNVWGDEQDGEITEE